MKRNIFIYIFRRYANFGYLLSNIFVGILCSFILFRNFDIHHLISNEILIQTQVYKFFEIEFYTLFIFLNRI